jgi:PKD repeat protein
VRILFPTNEEIASFYPLEKTVSHKAGSSTKEMQISIVAKNTVQKAAPVRIKSTASTTRVQGVQNKDTRIVSWIKAVFRSE